VSFYHDFQFIHFYGPFFKIITDRFDRCVLVSRSEETLTCPKL
jgi:hypothetical protein